MKPNKLNYCSGAFPDWLEVMLINTCNAKCKWCIEKDGYKPKKTISTIFLAKKILSCQEKNIILLGGEPLLYKKLGFLVYMIKDKKNIYITTNGTLLSRQYVLDNLIGITGLNISIHHYNLEKNKKITGRLIDFNNLMYAVKIARDNNIKVRFNCNIIKGNIDNIEEIRKYVDWVKILGVNSIRFAELKNDSGDFISLGKILNYRYGLNEEPFLLGCNRNVIIDNICINFRQMCGLQTYNRPIPQDYENKSHNVLYYNGRLYNGWQKEKKMAKQKELTRKGMQLKIKKLEKELSIRNTSVGCRY